MKKDNDDVPQWRKDLISMSEATPLTTFEYFFTYPPIMISRLDCILNNLKLSAVLTIAGSIYMLFKFVTIVRIIGFIILCLAMVGFCVITSLNVLAIYAFIINFASDDVKIICLILFGLCIFYKPKRMFEIVIFVIVLIVNGLVLFIVIDRILNLFKVIIKLTILRHLSKCPLDPVEASVTEFTSWADGYVKFCYKHKELIAKSAFVVTALSSGLLIFLKCLEPHKNPFFDGLEDANGTKVFRKNSPWNPNASRFGPYSFTSKKKKNQQKKKPNKNNNKASQIAAVEKPNPNKFNGDDNTSSDTVEEKNEPAIPEKTGNEVIDKLNELSSAKEAAARILGDFPRNPTPRDDRIITVDFPEGSDDDTKNFINDLIDGAVDMTPLIPDEVFYDTEEDFVNDMAKDLPPYVDVDPAPTINVVPKDDSKAIVRHDVVEGHSSEEAQFTREFSRSEKKPEVRKFVSNILTNAPVINSVYRYIVDRNRQGSPLPKYYPENFQTLWRKEKVVSPLSIITSDLIKSCLDDKDIHLMDVRKYVDEIAGISSVISPSQNEFNPYGKYILHFKFTSPIYDHEDILAPYTPTDEDLAEGQKYLDGCVLEENNKQLLNDYRLEMVSNNYDFNSKLIFASYMFRFNKKEKVDTYEDKGNFVIFRQNFLKKMTIKVNSDIRLPAMYDIGVYFRQKWLLAYCFKAMKEHHNLEDISERTVFYYSVLLANSLEHGIIPLPTKLHKKASIPFPKINMNIPPTLTYNVLYGDSEKRTYLMKKLTPKYYEVLSSQLDYIKTQKKMTAMDVFVKIKENPGTPVINLIFSDNQERLNYITICGNFPNLVNNVVTEKELLLYVSHNFIPLTPTIKSYIGENNDFSLAYKHKSQYDLLINKLSFSRGKFVYHYDKTEKVHHESLKGIAFPIKNNKGDIILTKGTIVDEKTKKKTEKYPKSRLVADHLIKFLDDNGVYWECVSKPTAVGISFLETVFFIDSQGHISIEYPMGAFDKFLFTDLNNLDHFDVYSGTTFKDVLRKKQQTASIGGIDWFKELREPNFKYDPILISKFTLPLPERGLGMALVHDLAHTKVLSHALMRFKQDQRWTRARAELGDYNIPFIFDTKNNKAHIWWNGMKKSFPISAKTNVIRFSKKKLTMNSMELSRREYLDFMAFAAQTQTIIYSEQKGEKFYAAWSAGDVPYEYKDYSNSTWSVWKGIFSSYYAKLVNTQVKWCPSYILATMFVVILLLMSAYIVYAYLKPGETEFTSRTWARRSKKSRRGRNIHGHESRWGSDQQHYSKALSNIYNDLMDKGEGLQAKALRDYGNALKDYEIEKAEMQRDEGGRFSYVQEGYEDIIKRLKNEASRLGVKSETLEKATAGIKKEIFDERTKVQAAVENIKKKENHFANGLLGHLTRDNLKTLNSIMDKDTITTSENNALESIVEDAYIDIDQKSNIKIKDVRNVEKTHFNKAELIRINDALSYSKWSNLPAAKQFSPTQLPTINGKQIDQAVNMDILRKNMVKHKLKPFWNVPENGDTTNAVVLTSNASKNEDEIVEMTSNNSICVDNCLSFETYLKVKRGLSRRCFHRKCTHKPFFPSRRWFELRKMVKDMNDLEYEYHTWLNEIENQNKLELTAKTRNNTNIQRLKYEPNIVKHDWKNIVDITVNNESGEDSFKGVVIRDTNGKYFLLTCMHPWRRDHDEFKMDYQQKNGEFTTVIVKFDPEIAIVEKEADCMMIPLPSNLNVPMRAASFFDITQIGSNWDAHIYMEKNNVSEFTITRMETDFATKGTFTHGYSGSPVFVRLGSSEVIVGLQSAIVDGIGVVSKIPSSWLEKYKLPISKN